MRAQFEPEARDLLADASGAYQRLGALYFDAKMRANAVPILSNLLYVGPPPGSGSDWRNTVSLIEPVIRPRNPEWIQNPDNVPTALREARRKGNTGNELLRIEPGEAVADHREKSLVVAREVGRLLDTPDLIGALDSPNAERRRTAEQTLLSDHSVKRALEIEDNGQGMPAPEAAAPADDGISRDAGAERGPEGRRGPTSVAD